MLCGLNFKSPYLHKELSWKKTSKYIKAKSGNPLGLPLFGIAKEGNLTVNYVTPFLHV